MRNIHTLNGKFVMPTVWHDRMGAHEPCANTFNQSILMGMSNIGERILKIKATIINFKLYEQTTRKMWTNGCYEQLNTVFAIGFLCVFLLVLRILTLATVQTVIATGPLDSGHASAQLTHILFNGIVFTIVEMIKVKMRDDG